MPSSPEELEEALKQFRVDILKAFANIQVEISALQRAVMESRPVSEDQLCELRDDARKRVEEFYQRYAAKIGPAHETR